jgi:hypothetical protein
MKAKTSPATLRRYKTITAKFCTSLGPIADRAVASVRPGHCEDHFSALTREGVYSFVVQKGNRKNKVKLVVPLHPRLAAHLQAIRAIGGEGFATEFTGV